MGVIHRDIKPANMMLTESGTLKLMDFGLARIIERERLTQIGWLVGTLEYMSPEQIRGQDMDPRSDLYSLGVVLYEMLTGQVPFVRAGNDYDLLKAHVENTPQPPRAIKPELPAALEEAVLRALSKYPQERFQNAADFRDALQNVLETELPNPDWRFSQDTPLIGSLAESSPIPMTRLPADIDRLFDAYPFQSKALHKKRQKQIPPRERPATRRPQKVLGLSFGVFRGPAWKYWQGGFVLLILLAGAAAMPADIAKRMAEIFSGDVPAPRLESAVPVVEPSLANQTPLKQNESLPAPFSLRERDDRPMSLPLTRESQEALPAAWEEECAVAHFDALAAEKPAVAPVATPGPTAVPRQSVPRRHTVSIKSKRKTLAPRKAVSTQKNRRVAPIKRHNPKPMGVERKLGGGWVIRK
jgi:serine/threonine protein kinase